MESIYSFFKCQLVKKIQCDEDYSYSVILKRYQTMKKNNVHDIL